MSVQPFTFEREFQMDILALMTQDFNFLNMCSELVKPEHFEDKILQWFFKTILAHLNTYNECPSPTALKQELMCAAQAKLVKAHELPEYSGMWAHTAKRVGSPQYVVDNLIRFCRRQAGRKVYVETVKLMETAGEQEWDEILNKLNDARNIGLNYMDQGLWFFEEVRDRAVKRQQGITGPVSKTGIRGRDPKETKTIHLDEVLGGGLRPEQLGIWMGNTGAGKSIALCHVGKYAITQGQKVLHYTLELSANDIAGRYDSAWSEVNFQELIGNAPKVVEAVEGVVDKHHCKGNLLIRGYPSGTASVSTIRNHVKNVIGYGWVPDLIIVDYLDLLSADRIYEKEYQALGKIAVDLRGLAGELKIPVWTATQANKGSHHVEIIDLDSTGDSYRKVQVADVVLTLNLKPHWRIANYLRVFVAKNRNGPAGVDCAITTDYANMRLFVGPAGTPPPKEDNTSGSKAAKDDYSSGDGAPGVPPNAGRLKP